MPALTCYRIRSRLTDGTVLDDFDQVVDSDNVTKFGPINGSNFEAKLYLRRAYPRAVDWGNYFHPLFETAHVDPSGSPSAVLLVRIRPKGKGNHRPIMFAFPFGPGGRFIIKSDVFDRGYGLRTALNLLYPRHSDAEGRLRSVDSKRRSTTILRSRFQVSHPSTFETFDDVNRQSDTVYRAAGIPHDSNTWGPTLSGADSLSLHVEIDITDIGNLCRQIEVAHRRDDYKDRFEWIDHIQPVADPSLQQELEELVCTKLRQIELEGLELAPPDVVDWEVVGGFHYHFDRPQGAARDAVRHPDLRLTDYVTGLGDSVMDITPSRLRSRHVDVVDGSGQKLYRWPVWRCLVGEIELHGRTFVLDEGDFFEVANDYLVKLDKDIEALPPSLLELPDTTPTESEGDYNIRAAKTVPGLLVLDRRLVRITNRTTPIEICDLLSRSRQLIHVKRHLGSSNLSHLFAQGLVSSELLQSSPEFRKQTAVTVASCSEDSPEFDFFQEDQLSPAEFEIVFAIAERWAGRSAVERLPFFSKVNLREVSTALMQRGFVVTFKQIEAVAALETGT